MVDFMFMDQAKVLFHNFPGGGPGPPFLGWGGPQTPPPPPATRLVMADDPDSIPLQNETLGPPVSKVNPVLKLRRC